MKATRLIRKAFPVIAYQVTEENMEILARWCEGEIIPANPDKGVHLHIRVPTSRPSPKTLVEARVGYWLVGFFHQRRKVFKPYTDARLAREFNFATEDDDLALDELIIDPKEFEEQPCCAHCKSTSIPKQAPPFRASPATMFQQANH